MTTLSAGLRDTRLAAGAGGQGADRGQAYRGSFPVAKVAANLLVPGVDDRSRRAWHSLSGYISLAMKACIT